MMPDERYTYLSSSMVKEVAALGGRLNGLVPPVVEDALQKKYLK
jgi:pantetheine-phosphate adenylyltransferase